MSTPTARTHRPQLIVTILGVSIDFACDGCGKQYAVADGMAGRRVRCKACGAAMTVPRPPAPLAVSGGLPTMACPQCGRVMPDTATYCRGCGLDFKAGPLYAPPPEPERPKRPLQRWHVVVGAIAAGVIVLAILAGLLIHGARRSAVARAMRMGLAARAGNATGVAHPPSHPLFTARQPPVHLAGGIDFYPVVIGGDGPGLPMQVYLYLPAGQREPHSLPCVFIAPAGSRLFHGMSLGEGDMPEHLPYVRAGFAVCAYELSGSLPGRPGSSLAWSAVTGPVRDFMAADGGVANARIAVNYVLAQVPEVNPQHLYAAGHSSAATVALDVAASDHRIRGVAAYAPACNLEQRLAAFLPTLERHVPGSSAFIARISPMRHVSDFACPIYLFHADDDANVATSDNQAFVDALHAAGKHVQFVRVPSGGHYDSMIDDGIPGGIEFFKSLGAAPLPPVLHGEARN
jgi:DNA-directed RNA polymerase subunit RPC12/RpoP